MPEKKTPAAKKTTAAKTSTRKTPTTKRTTTRAKAAPTKTSTQVAANARHIEENTKVIQNNSKMIHILYGTIILLMMIIAGLAFYVGQMIGNNTGPVVPSQEDIVVTVIDDSRCLDCQTDSIVGQLQTLPFLTNAEFVRQDFSDAGIEEYLTSNAITALPAIVMNTNILNDGGQVSSFLTSLPS